MPSTQNWALGSSAPACHANLPALVDIAPSLMAAGSLEAGVVALRPIQYCLWKVGSSQPMSMKYFSTACEGRVCMSRLYLTRRGMR
jgi:hypothetical protein